ncbi:Transcription factor 1 [Metarhizium brunneum]|uniref:pH-response transcription factor pacC/RIM101 n=1 Tax=Metarhizium brunneum TaxID=500148 RepID=A0A7D5Z2V2_9HYPO|nr:Transcription factor 1 [Metarhizium brunneum]
MTGPSLSQILHPPRPVSSVSDVPQPYRLQPQPQSRPNVAVSLPRTGASGSQQSFGIGHRSLATVPGSTESQPYRNTGESAPSSASASAATTTTTTSALPVEGSTSVTSSRQNHEGNNLYACRDCGRSYSRPEHLVRHVQTHTLGRRFTCEVCQKSFARKDLLRRHVANHENDSPQKRRRINSSPAAGRVSQACRPCAVARVKCDDSKPCRRCVNRKLTCIFSEAGPSSNPHHHIPPKTHATAAHDSGHSATAVAAPVAASSTESGNSSSPVAHSHANSAPNGPASGPEASSKTSPYSQTTSFKPEESQLPTPETLLDQANNEILAPPVYEPPTGVIDFNNSPFFDFLRDVLYEQPFDPNKMTTPQGMPVLDFCDNASLELTDLDFGMLDQWNMDGMIEGTMPAQDLIPRPENSAEINQMRKSLVKVWTESPWRWDPNSNDNGYKEQSFFAVSTQDTSSSQFQHSRDCLERVVAEKLEQSGRDRVMAILLSQCRQTSVANQVAASFPTVEVLDTLTHIYLAAQACQVDSWIHFPTFKLKDQWPEWIAMAAAHGGSLTPVPTLRKFGFAVMEAVRLSLPSRFEENNTAIQRLGLVQSLILVQDLGLWSGNRRRMEIAECHLVIPVTMMRYRGKFQRAKYPIINVDPSDEGEVLEEKWKLWIEREQWKRLVFHCYLREAQTSMTTLTNPCLSYSELTLPLPEARELWLAKTAQEWKAQYLERNAGLSKRPPSVGDLFHDVHLLTANHARLDVQFSISIFLHGFWALILEYRQLSSVHKSRSYANSLGGNPNLLLSSRHQELVKDLQSFHLIAAGWQGMSAREHLLLYLLMMNLHVSLDDLQLFLGKEGEDQARRIYPILQQWITSSEARSAAWCASQVLRYAKFFPPGHLKDFYAVAVHHASITLWTYGVVTRANRRQYVASQIGAEPIYLDSADSIAIQRFIGFEQGRPMIKGPAIRGTATEAALHAPRACMEMGQDVLRVNFTQAQEGLPAMVENLIQLIKQLGNAAWAVGLG